MSARARTLRDLAQRLDVSVATVSRALAGDERIALRTRQRVTAAARTHGYVPNQAARALVTGRSGFVALLMPSRGFGHADPFFGEFVGGLTEGLAEHGMDLFLAAVPRGASELAVIRHLVEARRADGIVLARTREDDDRVGYLIDRAFPFVSHGRIAAESPGFDWVDTDGARAFGEAFDLLYGLGHRHMALVTIAEPMTFRRHREAGLAQAIARCGDASVRLDVVAAPRFDGAARQEAIRATLAGPERPTAVLGLFDGLALATIAEAGRLGLSVPDELSVIGFDDTAAAAHASPGLTTFDAAIHACATEMAEMLVARMREPGRAPRTHLLRPRIVLRGSHGPVSKPIP